MANYEPLKAPAWINLPPSEWPPAARGAYELLLLAAERRMAAERAQTKAGDPDRAA